MGNRGITLIELAVGGAITLLLALGMGFAYKQAIVISTATSGKVDSTQDQLRLVTAMMRIGRIARQNTCATTIPGDGNNILTCIVDMHIPPTEVDSDDTSIRFRMDTALRQVFYEMLNAAGAWETKDTFNSIARLELCDHASMIGTPATCTFNDAMLTRYQQNALGSYATSANRFFRFRVTTEQGTMGKFSFLNGAFYMRHPTPVGDLRYQFGSRE